MKVIKNSHTHTHTPYSTKENVDILQENKNTVKISGLQYNATSNDKTAGLLKK